MLPPPNDLKAEMAVIGSLLVDCGLFRYKAASLMLNADMFYYDSNRIVFKAIGELSEKHEPADVILVSRKIAEHGMTEKIGGSGYLVDCLHAVTTAEHLEHYCAIVARLYYEREIINACRRTALEPDSEGVENVRELVMLREKITADMALDIVDVFHEKFEKMGRKEYQKAYKVGFKNMDNYWCGCHAGEINTWAAATNKGKSVMLQNILVNSSKIGYNCLYFGTEMTAGEVSNRLMSMSGGPTISTLRSERLNDGQNNLYRETAEKFVHSGKIKVVDDPEPNLSDIERAITETNPDVVFLDYLERFELPREENMRLRVKEFMRKIKTMARKHKVVIHLAAQLNRKSYGQDDMAPTMAEISESSAVEKESDRVILMHQPKKRNEMASTDRIIEAVVAKNRHGRGNMGVDFRMDEVTLTITEII